MPRYVDTEAIDAMCEKNWAGSTAIRTEFKGNKDAYKAYWRAVARGQTPMPKEAKAAAPSAVAAPTVVARQAASQPASVSRIAFGGVAADANQYSKMTGIRAFYATNPTEAKKQYPQQVKQLEEAKERGYV